MDVFTTNAEGFLEILKHPNADLVYTLDLEPYVGAETVSVATWSVVTAGITIESQGLTAKKTSVRLSGGARDRVYWLHLEWTFGADNRVDAREVKVQVKLR